MATLPTFEDFLRWHVEEKEIIFFRKIDKVYEIKNKE